VVCGIGHDLDGVAVDICFLQLRGSFTTIAALALATAVFSRLFSILRLNSPASIAGLNPPQKCV
jgi:hypothetical protein